MDHTRSSAGVVDPELVAIALDPALSGITLDDVVERVEACWATKVELGGWHSYTANRYMLVVRRFAKFARAYDVALFSDVSADLVAAYIVADGRNRGGVLKPVSYGTQYARANALRAFFAEVRDSLGLNTDSAEKVTRLRKGSADTRPLTVREKDRLVAFILADPTAIQSVSAALALTGLHTGEIAFVTVADLDLARRTIRGAGVGARVESRTLDIRPELWPLIRDRAAAVRDQNPGLDDGELNLTSNTARNNLHSRQANVVTAIRTVMKRAALSDPILKPESLPAFAAWELFQVTGHIEDAALLLGSKTLDTAARIVGFSWREDGAAR